MALNIDPQKLNADKQAKFADFKSVLKDVLEAASDSAGLAIQSSTVNGDNKEKGVFERMLKQQGKIQQRLQTTLEQMFLQELDDNAHFENVAAAFEASMNEKLQGLQRIEANLNDGLATGLPAPVDDTPIGTPVQDKLAHDESLSTTPKPAIASVQEVQETEEPEPKVAPEPETNDNLEQLKKEYPKLNDDILQKLQASIANTKNAKTSEEIDDDEIVD